MTNRPTPYGLVFGALGPERFPAVEGVVRAAGYDPRDRDGFVLVQEAVELLRILRPDEGVGGAIDELVGFTHAAFLFWRDGERVVELDREALDRVLNDSPTTGGAPAEAASYSLQLPSARIWGEPLAGQPPEPLDGGFVRMTSEGARVLAVFGFHPGRGGFTAVEVEGRRPGRLARVDRTTTFASRLDGGAPAGLRSVAGPEELLELVFRCHAALGPAGPQPGRQRLTSA